MTRRERLERKIERRSEWAASATAKSDALATASHDMLSAIPFGQPILVGHHSERRDRNYRNRAWNKMGQAVELSKKAEMHESKAANLEAALERTVFSDDENAVEAIEARIAAREAEREQMKVINRLYKKADAEGLKALGVDYDALKEKLAALGAYFGQAPHMPYELSNLGGRISADKKRLEAIKRQNARKDAAAATENGVTVTDHGNDYTSVTFAEKPDYAIIRALKDAGFRWGAGSWFGQTANVPECVRALVETPNPEPTPQPQTFRNTHYTQRDYEATNIVACVAQTAPGPQWEAADESILAPLTQLWIETVSGQDVRYYGYL